MPKRFPISNDALLLLNQFYKPCEIASQLNLKPNTVSSKLYRLRLGKAYTKRLLRSRRSVTLRQRNAKIIQLKKATCLGPTSIAKQLNLSKNTVIGVLYRYNKKQKPHSEACGRRVNALSLTHFGN